MSIDIVADTACPECAAGKHSNCDGGSWDITTDAPGACPCWAAGHKDDQIPAEVVERLDAVVSAAADVMRRTSPDEAHAIVAALRQTPQDENADRLANAYEAELDRRFGDA